MLRAVLVSGFICYAVLKYMSPYCTGTLPNSQIVVVTRLSKNSQHGIGELKNELVLLMKLWHKNLVIVIGVCLEEQEKLIAYEIRV